MGNLFAQSLEMSQQGVGYAVNKGEKIVRLREAIVAQRKAKLHHQRQLRKEVIPLDQKFVTGNPTTLNVDFNQLMSGSVLP